MPATFEPEAEDPLQQPLPIGKCYPLEGPTKEFILPNKQLILTTADKLSPGEVLAVDTPTSVKGLEKPPSLCSTGSTRSTPREEAEQPSRIFGAARRALEAAGTPRRRRLGRDARARRTVAGASHATGASFEHVMCAWQNKQLEIRLAEAGQVLAWLDVDLKEQCGTRGREVSELSQKVASLRARLNPGGEERDELMFEAERTRNSGVTEDDDQMAIEEHLAQGATELKNVQEKLQVARQESAIACAQLSLAAEISKQERLQGAVRTGEGIKEHLDEIKREIRVAEAARKSCEDHRAQEKKAHEAMTDSLAVALREARVALRRARRAARSTRTVEGTSGELDTSHASVDALGGALLTSASEGEEVTPGPGALRRRPAVVCLRAACAALGVPTERLLGLFGAHLPALNPVYPSDWLTAAAQHMEELRHVLQTQMSERGKASAALD